VNTPATSTKLTGWYHLLTSVSLTNGWRYLLAGVVISLVLVWVDPLHSWPHVRLCVTWIHEAGHAFSTLLLSGSVRGIRLNRDTSGVTNCALPTTGGIFGRARSGVVSATGTPSPIIVGAGIGIGLGTGRVHLVLGILIVILFLTLPLIRNWWGLLVVLVLAALLSISWFAPPYIQGTFLGILAGVLSLGGLKTIFEGATQRNGDGTSDAEQVSSCLFIPAILVEAIWAFIWVVSVVAVVIFATKYS
jgi:hypothetical protein